MIYIFLNLLLLQALTSMYFNYNQKINFKLASSKMFIWKLFLCCHQLIQYFQGCGSFKGVELHPHSRLWSYIHIEGCGATSTFKGVELHPHSRLWSYIHIQGCGATSTFKGVELHQYSRDWSYIHIRC